MAKHSLKITLILMTMFIVTQLIGLFVMNHYLSPDNEIPYGFEQQPIETVAFDIGFLISLVLSFVVAISLFLLLMKVKSPIFIRLWFFIVAALAIGITFNVILSKYILSGSTLLSALIGCLISYLIIYRRNILAHNIGELLIYPGIAAIFVGIISLPVIILLLVIISAYDAWAVWHSGFMQKMVKFQVDKVKTFSGFFIPVMDQKTRQLIKMLRQKYKTKKSLEKAAKKHKLRVQLAILGGGDIAWTMIPAGVILKTTGSIIAALIVIACASLALLYLFVLSEKKKYYPAMPYLTIGIYIGMLISLWLFG